MASVARYCCCCAAASNTCIHCTYTPASLRGTFSGITLGDSGCVTHGGNDWKLEIVGSPVINLPYTMSHGIGFGVCEWTSPTVENGSFRTIKYSSSDGSCTTEIANTTTSAAGAVFTRSGPDCQLVIELGGTFPAGSPDWIIFADTIAELTVGGCVEFGAFTNEATVSGDLGSSYNDGGYDGFYIGYGGSGTLVCA